MSRGHQLGDPRFNRFGLIMWNDKVGETAGNGISKLHAVVMDKYASIVHSLLIHYTLHVNLQFHLQVMLPFRKGFSNKNIKIFRLKWS